MGAFVMSFVARELDRISARLRDPEHLPPGKYELLYAAQQALAWTLEPEGFKAPYDAIMGIPAEPEDCSERSRLASS
jgi:hypothetical protein